MNIRQTVVIACIVGCYASAAPKVSAEEWTGNVNLSAGLKFLDSDWKPAEDQRAFGLQGDFRRENWPVNLFASYTWAKSAAEDVEIPSGGTVTTESRTNEIDLGVRKYAERFEEWKPFIGAGISMLSGEIETRGPISAADDSDTAVGFWGALGALYTWNDFINAGAQVKYSKGDVDLNGETFNAGGLQLSALLGVHF